MPLTASITSPCQQEAARCVPYLPHYGSIYVHATKIGLLTSVRTTPTGSRRGGRARNTPHLFNFHSPCRKFNFAQGKKGSADGTPPVSPDTAPNRSAANDAAALSLWAMRPAWPFPPRRPLRNPEHEPPERVPGRGRRTGHAAGLAQSRTVGLCSLVSEVRATLCGHCADISRIHPSGSTDYGIGSCRASLGPLLPHQHRSPTSTPSPTPPTIR